MASILQSVGTDCIEIVQISEDDGVKQAIEVPLTVTLAVIERKLAPVPDKAAALLESRHSRRSPS
jgi:hypothetical protein